MLMAPIIAAVQVVEHGGNKPKKLLKLSGCRVF
jgi:hypothetical protein